MRSTKARVSSLILVSKTISPVFDLARFSHPIYLSLKTAFPSTAQVAIPRPHSPAHKTLKTIMDLYQKPRSSRVGVEEVRGAEGSEVKGAGKVGEEEVAPAEAAEG